MGVSACPNCKILAIFLDMYNYHKAFGHRWKQALLYNDKAKSS